MWAAGAGTATSGMAKARLAETRLSPTASLPRVQPRPPGSLVWVGCPVRARRLDRNPKETGRGSRCALARSQYILHVQLRLAILAKMLTDGRMLGACSSHATRARLAMAAQRLRVFLCVFMSVHACGAAQ